MKKIVVFILCLTLALLGGCTATNNVLDSNNGAFDSLLPQLPSTDTDGGLDNENPPTESLPPVITPTIPEVVPPTVDNGSDNDGTNNDGASDNLDQTDQEEKKKFYIRSNTNGLRVRSKDNLSSAVLGSLDKNDMVRYIGTSGDFYITEFKEQTAFVYKDMCTLVQVDSSSKAVEDAIDLGATLLGHPYVWGSQRYHWGNGVLNKNFVAGEFDCSALVLYVYYKSCGVILDVTSRAQSLNGTEVKRSDLKRGDLMFFTNASRYNKTGIERIGHVGIYFGDNYILHTASDHAVIEPISETRWSYYVSARRVV